MADKINDGGPAFPRRLAQVENREDFYAHELCAQSGMSLRDWFAGMAMQEMIGSYRMTMRGTEDAQTSSDADYTSFNRDMAIDTNHKTGEPDGANEIASDAYVFADAMLKAREAANGNH